MNELANLTDAELQAALNHATRIRQAVIKEMSDRIVRDVLTSLGIHA